mmetsp:Transcript_51944/g.105789  ORF Transcript_51944/g.105789 Transcript_51944/m.105789 type:complete len:264 (-) Transcript_51944:792-1583(-)
MESRTRHSASSFIFTTSGSSTLAVPSPPSSTITGAIVPSTLALSSSSDKKVFIIRINSFIVASRRRTVAREQMFSATCSRTGWFGKSSPGGAGWAMSARTGRMWLWTAAASRREQKAARFLEAAVRTSSSTSCTSSCRNAPVWSRMGLAGCIAAQRGTKCCALRRRMALDLSSCRLSENAPKRRRASSGERRWTMATTFTTAISRTDSWTSVERSLKMGTSSLMSTSFSTTAASAGMCANAALRTSGMSSLASCSYNLRRVGR